MKKNIIRTLIMFFIIINSIPVKLIAQWSQTYGPCAGTINALGSFGSNIYAGTNTGGFFFSTNSGSSWTAANNGLTSLNIRSLCINGTNIFAGTNGGGICVSFNNGSTWTAINNGANFFSVESIILTQSGRLFAASYGTGVFVSANNGGSWSQVNTGLTNLNVKALASIGSNIFAGTENGGVFWSTNNGSTWTAVNNGLASLNVTSLAVSGTTVFAGTIAGSMFSSTNNGSSWTTATTYLGDVNTIAVSGATIFVGTQIGMLFSPDFGATWTTANGGTNNPPIYSITINGSNIFSGTSKLGVLKSTNNGSYWVDSNQGLINTDVNALAQIGPYLTAGTAINTFISSNSGISWAQINMSGFTTQINALATSGANIFAGMWGSGIYLSTNNGLSWNILGNSLAGLNRYVYSLTVSGTNIFAGTAGGVNLSTNNGRSWTSLNSGFAANTNVFTIAATGNTLFAGTNTGMYLSTNSGSSWALANTGLPVANCQALIMNGSYIFAGTAGSGIYVSSNNGASWAAANNGLPLSNVYCFALSGSTIFAGTGAGIFVSTNNGSSWAALNTGLTNTVVTSLLINGNDLYAGTRGAGVFVNHSVICVPMATISPSGSVNFCSTSANILQANTGTGLTYQWKKNNVNIAGATNSNYTVTTSGTYTVVVTNSCGSSTSAGTVVTLSTSFPATPAGISAIGGNTKVCPGETKVYTSSTVTGATSYTWTPPIGATITAGQGTKTVTVNYTAAFTASDTIRVVAVNACGSSAQRTLKITRNTPSTPSVITGSAFGVCNLSNVPYSITNVTGMTYNWSFSIGTANVNSGQGSNSITANFGAGYVTGSLKVNASNACSTSANRTLTIKATPATPVSITGATTVCANQQGVPYSISPIASATNYTWSGPTGAHVSDGTTTSAGTNLTTTATNVTVNYGSTAGKINARANNTCGSGSYKNITVTFTCRESGEMESALENQDDLGVIIQPNPSTGIFEMMIPSAQNKNTEIEIYSPDGRLIKKQIAETNNPFTIDLTQQSDGIYFIHALVDGHVFIEKLAKR